MFQIQHYDKKSTKPIELPNLVDYFPQWKSKNPYLLKTPPKSEAFKHSGGASRLCTSATVTLYFDVELSKDSLPGTEQKMSTGVVANKRPSLLLGSRALIPVRK